MAIDATRNINALEQRIFESDAARAFLAARRLVKLPLLITYLEMLENRTSDEDALIAWLRSFLDDGSIASEPGAEG